MISHSSKGGTITAAGYLQEIAKTMSASLLGEGSGIKIEVDAEAEALDIDPDRAVPFGLLVNELTTNAVKHAFPGGAGCVVLSVKQEGASIALTITDNGIGMKGKDAAPAPERRGFNYVTIFVRQLGGTIAPASEGDGTTVKILLPRLTSVGGPKRFAA